MMVMVKREKEERRKQSDEKEMTRPGG